ncbi:hypothetical protein DSCA_26980 [Desulfosarcina alkanivorans]|nr:hypothetical protein DSCA_26980 [Desulfosarcina alkanivorans]
MKVRMVVVAATLAMLWGTGAAVAASDVKDPSGKAPSTVAAAGMPEANLPELAFQFDPVVDGTQVTHDFAIRNGGNGPLAITNVKTG